MLAGNPALFSPPELHLLHFDRLADWHRTLAGSYLDEGLIRALMNLHELDVLAAREMLAQWEAEGLSVQAAYARLQEASRPRLLVDKSPTYAAAPATLGRAEAMFEAPRFIHLVRHPQAMIESFVRRRMNRVLAIDARDPPGLAERLWTESYGNLERLAAQGDPDHHLLVRYEELVTVPEETLRNICAFLGVDFDPAMLNPYEGERMIDGLHDASMPIGDPGLREHDGIDQSLADRWRADPPRRLLTQTLNLAKRLGYAPHEPAAQAASDTPPAMQSLPFLAHGLTLDICEWGRPGDPIMLCIHGMLDQGASWSLVAGHAMANGFRVLAPDLRGHGRSEHVPGGGAYRLVDHIGDMDALLAGLDQDVVLVGHSMGAAVAAILASVRPQRMRALVLVELPEPLERTDAELAQAFITRADLLTRERQHPVMPSVAAAAERLVAANPRLPHGLASMLAERSTRPSDQGLTWTWDPLLETRCDAILDAMTLRGSTLDILLQRVEVPILLIDADDGRRQPPRTLPLRPGQTLRRIRIAGGHNLHTETAAALANAIFSVAHRVPA